jgi:outer membrane immunogenic protein
MRGVVVSFIVALAGGMSGGALAQPAPIVDWSGFHVSGLVGATVGLSDAKASPRRSGSTYFSGTDFDQLTSDGTGNLTELEWSGSLKGGYSRQFGSFLVGIEASADTPAFDDARFTTATYQSNAAARYLLEQRVKANWMATLRPRLGWAQDNWLVYVTAGPAVTRVTVETTFSDNFSFGGGCCGSGHSSSTQTKFGAAYGLGGDYALGQNWSLTTQYLYTDFGRVKTSTTVVHPGAGAGSSVLDSSADVRTHAAMIGVTYRFNSF